MIEGFFTDRRDMVDHPRSEKILEHFSAVPTDLVNDTHSIKSGNQLIASWIGLGNDLLKKRLRPVKIFLCRLLFYEKIHCFLRCGPETGTHDSPSGSLARWYLRGGTGFFPRVFALALSHPLSTTITSVAIPEFYAISNISQTTWCMF